MNIKIIAFISLVLLSKLVTQGTPLDSLPSLVKLEEIKFNTPFEKKAFDNHFINKQNNYLELFSALSPETDDNTFQLITNKYYDQLENIKKQKLNLKKDDKKIKAIYKNVHDSFLKKYELHNEFSHIFKNGEYNCVSASALYGMIFDHLKIPFTIKETPEHVYIVSYPETQRILVETTDPKRGLYVFDQKYKNNYLNNLKSNKLISNEELASNSLDQLFDKYYFPEEGIDLEKLVGIQYMNSALTKLDKNKPEEALDQLEKAYLFYPCEKAFFLIQNTLEIILQDQDFKKVEYVTYLSKLARFKDAANTTNLYAHFYNITQNFLIKDYKPAHFKEIYENLVDCIDDNETKKHVSFVYFYENGRVLYNKGMYNESIEATKQAFKITPENSDVQTLLTHGISQSLNGISDNIERIKTLEVLSEEYPLLLENNVFNSNLAQVYLVQFAQEFELGNGKEAEKYKKTFEKLFQTYSNIPIESNLIGRAYSLGAVFYFKKGDKLKTKQTLQKGLELAPNNYELKQRLAMLR